MSAAVKHEPEELGHPDLRWRGDQAVLSGALLSLYRRLDAIFARLGALEGAPEVMYPTLIEAEHLAKLDYFRSFPHLCTFACNLDRDADKRASFARSPELSKMALAPVTHVLTPAACYHVYVELAGRALPAFRPVGSWWRSFCCGAPAERLPLSPVAPRAPWSCPAL